MKLSSCTRCHLHATRKQVVLAKGAGNYGVMLVGEAPGTTENAQGQPFVGKAGQELDKWLYRFAKFSPDDFYITNTVKCWPCNEQRNGNRTPTEEELTACAPWLDAEIARIKPWLIVALGSTAAARLTGNPTLGPRVGTLEWCPAPADCPVLITYHPAYLVRGNGEQDYQRDFSFLSRVLVAISVPAWEKMRRSIKENGILSLKEAETQ